MAAEHFNDEGSLNGGALELTALAILGERDDEPWIVVSSEETECLRITFGSFHRLLIRGKSLLRDCGSPELVLPTHV